ncbi:MAG: ribbon-helix-helix protein, CopG family [Mycobacteriaceae bacterium]
MSDELWDAVKRIALDRGETTSDVVRRALELYVRAWPSD